MKQLDLGYGSGVRLLAGVDEVGRGPLAGPVVAAAVILDPERPIAGLRDSKALSPKRRGELAEELKAKALAWAIGEADVAEIDRINILQASLAAMARAVKALEPAAEYALVDGNRCPDLPCAAEAIVGGDNSVPVISAASILAKEYRDAAMVRWERDYPGYGFAAHKGYGTAQHIEALERLGPCDLHRRSFAPVRKLI